MRKSYAALLLVVLGCAHQAAPPERAAAPEPVAAAAQAPKRGWRNLTWGMMPAEVEAWLLMEGPAKFLEVPSSTPGQRLFGTVLAEPLVGRRVFALFTFVPGGLNAVELREYEPKGQPLESCQDWYSALQGGLREKYGPPSCKEGLKHPWQCIWASVPEATIGLRLESLSPGCEVVLLYLNPDVVDAEAARQLDQL